MKNSISTFNKLLVTIILLGVSFVYYHTSYDAQEILKKLLISGEGYSFYDYSILILIYSLYLVVISTWLHLYLEVNIGFSCTKYITRRDWIKSILKLMKSNFFKMFFVYFVIVIFLYTCFSDDIMSIINLSYLISCFYLCFAVFIITKVQLLLSIKYNTLHSVISIFILFVIGLLIIKSKFIKIYLSFEITSNEILNVLIIMIGLICINKVFNKLILELVEEKEFA